MKLVVGLGNPGEKYSRTRHNVGFQALDALATGQGVLFSSDRGNSLTARLNIGSQPVLAVKPQAFMNLSGGAVQAHMAFHKIRPEDLFVIVDDVTLDVGRFRLRAEGSHGGHNGLRDIESRIGKVYNRLRIGVGSKPADWDLADWVLSRFAPDEFSFLEKRLSALENCLQMWMEKGLSVAATLYNGPTSS